MVHVFVLILYIGIGSERVAISTDLYFKRLDICNWYAEHLVRRFGYPETRDYGTAYCVPKSVDPSKVKIYD